MVLIAANQDTVFSRLAEAMGQAGLATDPQYSTHGARGANQVELDALVETLDADPDHARGARRSWTGSACRPGLIYRAPEMLDDPHFKAREAIVTVPHPDFGELRMQNVAPKLSETPGSDPLARVPRLGQHNDEVYLRTARRSAQSATRSSRPARSSEPGA